MRSLMELKESFSKLLTNHHDKYYSCTRRERLDRATIEKNYARLRFGSASDFYTDYFKDRMVNFSYNTTDMLDLEHEDSMVPRINSYCAEYGRI